MLAKTLVKTKDKSLQLYKSLVFFMTDDCQLVLKIK